MKAKAARKGDQVFTSSGQKIGNVAAVRGNSLRLENARVWLPAAAVEARGHEIVRLAQGYDFLGNEPRKGRGVPVLAPVMLVLAGLVYLWYRNRDRQKRAGRADWPGYGTEEQDRSTPAASYAEPAPTFGPGTPPFVKRTPEGTPIFSAGTEEPDSETTPVFSSLDLSERVITDKENEIVAEVTQAFPTRGLRVNAVGVHKLEGGGEVATLRFTLDEEASSDIEFARLESSQEDAEKLAHEVIDDLRSQLPRAG